MNNARPRTSKAAMLWPVVATVALFACAPREAVRPGLVDATCGVHPDVPHRTVVIAGGVARWFDQGGVYGPRDAFGVAIDGQYTWAALPGGPVHEPSSPPHDYPGTSSQITRANAGTLGIDGDYALMDVVLNCDGEPSSPWNTITWARRLDGTTAWPARLDAEVRALVDAQRERERAEANALEAILAPLRAANGSGTPERWDLPLFTVGRDQLRVAVQTRYTETVMNGSCGIQTRDGASCNAPSAIIGYELTTTWQLAGDGTSKQLDASPPRPIEQGFPPRP